MSLDISTVRANATQARIEVKDEDLAPLAGELSNILSFVEQLAEVDTSGVEPLIAVADQGLAMRDDAVTEGGVAPAVLANAPEAEEGFFTVP